MTTYKLPRFIGLQKLRRCFICNTVLNHKNYTLEHLIPQWIIRRFGLEEHTITFDHNVTIKYLDFVLPCCRECNCNLLSPIETSLYYAFSSSAHKPTQIPIDTFAVWSCKIFTGVHLYEAALQKYFTTHKKCSLRNIVPKDLCRFYLRMLRGQVRITHINLDFPFTIFVFPTKLPRKQDERFDFQLARNLNALYLRLGRWSLLSRFDGGYLALYGKHFFEPFFRRRLAPLQVEELAAHFFTMAERQAHRLLYVHRRYGKLEEIEYLPVPLRRPFITPKTCDDFAYWFSYFTRVPASTLVTPNHRRTFLLDDAGHLMNIPGDRDKCFAQKHS